MKIDYAVVPHNDGFKYNVLKNNEVHTTGWRKTEKEANAAAKDDAYMLRLFGEEGE